MPRPRTGLGQGLEALVPPMRESGNPISPLNRPAPIGEPVPWEIATLRRRNRKRCVLTIAPAGLLESPKRRKLRASLLLSLGALGAAGWELTAVTGDTFYFKRPAVAQAQE